jgi:cell division transport system permease protein
MKLLFIIRQTLNSLWRERTPVTASILTISVALTILIALFEISWVLYSNLNSLKQNMVVEVYLDSEIGDMEATRIRDRLLEYGTTEQMRIVGKGMAADIFREEFGEDINDILDQNPLPVMIEVRLQPEYNHPDYMALFKKQCEAIPGVDEVHYRHVLIEKLEAITEAVIIGGVILLLVLLLVMNLLIRNTIKLSVYARRQQIAVMKILGAGNMFIRMPYILEGAFEGLVGGLMAAGALILSHRFISGTFAAVTFPAGTYKLLWVISITSGIVLGFFLSAAAVGRFINKIHAKK